MATKRFSSSVELAGEVEFPDQRVLAQRFGLLAASPDEIGLDPSFGDCRFGVLHLAKSEVPIIVPATTDPPPGTCLVLGSLLALPVRAVSPTQKETILPQAVVVAQRIAVASQPKKTVSLIGQVGTRRIPWTREVYLAKGAAPLLVVPEGPVPKPGAVVRIDGSVASYEVLRPWLTITLLCVRGQIVELGADGAPVQSTDEKRRSAPGAIDGARRAALSLIVDVGRIPGTGAHGAEEGAEAHAGEDGEDDVEEDGVDLDVEDGEDGEEGADALGLGGEDGATFEDVEEGAEPHAGEEAEEGADALGLGGEDGSNFEDAEDGAEESAEAHAGEDGAHTTPDAETPAPTLVEVSPLSAQEGWDVGGPEGQG